VFLHTGTGYLLVPFIGFAGGRTRAFKEEYAQQQSRQDQFSCIEFPVQEVIPHYSLFFPAKITNFCLSITNIVHPTGHNFTDNQ
jgi:hypothetical protein